ncbi:MAG: hypothetical protein HDR07_05100 [Lachnospiraceae bacterium]|nr:hypothetical protein [Lachnospiraceae bacterium]
MSKKMDKKYLIGFGVIWVVLMASAFYFCTLKQGFHEDEFYTYYSTARTNGFYVEDGKWMEQETYRNEFVVLPGERFQYGLVKQVQSWDVHPPMYYWVFHTVASLVPGVFSKWIGLSVNLFFHGINLILLTYLSYLVSGRDVKMAYLVTLVFGLSPASMSGVVFIRMYEMLTTFVLLCAVLHIRAVQRPKGETEWEEDLSFAKLLVLMAVVTYVGFLTQYYYFIFLFYMALAFCVYLLWRDRNLYSCLWYGFSQAVAFILAYLTYPSCLGQMFRGQRGAQATENFFDISNTFERVWFFLDLMNSYVFGYLFFVILIVVVSLAVRVRRRGGVTAKEGVKQDGLRFGITFWMLLFAAAGYFLTVSKTALLLGETSNRYQLPVYGIVVFLLLFGCRTLWRQAVALINVKPIIKADKKPGILYRLCPSAVKVLLFIFELIGDLWGWIFTLAIKQKKYMEKLALLFCAAAVVMAYLRVDVVFLYPRAREEVALAREQAAEDIPVVYVYKPGEEWCVWAVADVLMEYDRVYFVSAESEDVITEPAIANADALVAYLPLYDDVKDEEAQNMRIAASCGASEAELQYLYKYCGSWCLTVP